MADPGISDGVAVDCSRFCVKDFKENLRKNKQIVKTLTEYIKYARAPSGKQVVSGFLQDSVSMDSPEFLALFAEKRPMNELTTIFEALEVTFLYVADDLQMFEIWAMNMTKQLLDSQNIRCIYQGLRMTNTSTQIKNTLNFLTSMVTVSTAVAREVASRFNFKGGALMPLLHKTNVKDTADVRLCLIHFLMAFLMTGDHILISKIIDQKGVLNNVFPGLPNDKVTTIEVFLSALKSQVVENNSILKTVKIRLLNNYTLGFVFKLFKWRGIFSHAKKKKMELKLSAAEIEGITALNDSKDASVVHQLAHEFLVAVCCSSKNGIIFLDNTFGSSGSNVNHTITELLKSIEKPYETPMLEETILQILKACPDQMSFYFHSIQKAYEVRPSVPWQKSMEFLIKALRSHDLSRILDSVDKETNVSQLISILLNVISTSVFKCDNLEAIFKNSNFNVRDYGLRYAEVILQQTAVAVSSTCLARFVHSTEEVKAFHENFATRLQMLLPSFGSLQQCWDLATSYMENAVEIGTDFPDSAALYTHLKMLISLFENYIHTFHTAYCEFEKENDKLLVGLGRLKNHLNENEYLEIQTLIFQLLSKSSLAHSLLIQKVNEKSVALILCETILYSRESAIQQMAKQLMKKLLIATKLFSSMEDELDIWINNFLQSYKASLSAVLFFNDVITDLVSNSQTYFDETKDHILKALGSSADKESERLNAIFDEILNEDIVDYSSIFSGGTASLLTANMTSQYSPLVLVALKHFESSPAKDGDVSKSLSSVLLNLLHGSHQQSVLAHLLRDYFHIFPEYLRNILNNLTGEKVATKKLTESKMRKTLNKCATLGDFVRVLFETNQQPVDGAANSVFRKLFSTASTEDICLVVQQILAYLNLLLAKENEEVSEELVCVFCDILMFIINEDPTVDGKSQICDVKEDCSITRSSDKICSLVLSHPVIQKMFLQPRLINTKNEDCPALWQLTKLTLLTLKKPGSCNEGANCPLIFSQRIAGFVLQALTSLLSGEITSIKLPIPLVEIIDPILTISNLSTACSILDALIQLSAEQLMHKKKCKSNQAGQLLVSILSFIVTLSPKVNRPMLTAKQLARCAEMYVKMRKLQKESAISTEKGKTSYVFGSVFLQLLNNHPLSSVMLSQDIFRFCLEDVDSEISLQLTTALVQHNLQHAQLVEDFICNNELTEMEVLKYVSLTKAVLCGLHNTCWTKRSENCSQFLGKLIKLYWPSILSAIFESKDSDLLDQLDVGTASDLLFMFVELGIAGTDEMLGFAERCVQHCSLQQPISLVVLKSAKNMFLKLSGNECTVTDLNPSTVYAFLLIKSILVLSKNANENDVNSQERKMMVTAAVDFLEKNDCLPDLGKILHTENCWHYLLKILLKEGLRDENGAEMLQLFKDIIFRLKQNSELLKLQVKSIFDHVFCHSNFLPGLLNLSAKNSTWRETLVNLLTFLVETEQTICSETHLPIYLAAYRSTLSSVDQKLLRLMFYYEKHGVDFYSFKPFVFGETAIDHYSGLRSKTQSLWKELSTKEYLSLFDKNKLLKTAMNFPLDLALKFENPDDQHCSVTTEPCKELYDPRFVMLSFVTLLSPESFVHCKHFIKCNGLGLVFAALGSKCKNMRAVAYHVLQHLYEHLEGTKIHLRLPWTSLLDCIRNSMTKQNLQLPNILTVFLTKATQLLLHPGDSVAKPVVNYLFVKQDLDLWNIPDFYQMFSHHDLTHQFAYRNWILSTMCEGLRTLGDYKICQKRYAFKIILSFYNSPLASSCVKLKILEVVKAAVKICPVLTDLIQKQGLFGSLHAALRTCNERIFFELMDIVEFAWTSISKDNKELSLIVASEFHLILFAMLEHISSSTPSNVFRKYISCLASVLNWIAEKEKKSKAVSVYLTNTFIMKVMHLSASYVEERKPDIVSDQNFSGLIHAPIKSRCNSDGTEADSSNNKSDDTCGIMLHRNILDILLCWQPCLTPIEIAQQNSLRNPGHTSHVFKAACNLMLKLFTGSNFEHMQRIYSWINICLQSDASNSLMQALIWPNQNTKCCDFFEHLFKAYESLLTVRAKDHSQMHFNPSEPREKIFDIVVQISRVLVTIFSKIVSRDGVFANVTTTEDFPQDLFLQLLFSQNGHDIFNIPDVQSLAAVVNAAEIGDNCHEAAVSIAMIGYLLWHQVDDLELVVEFIKQLNVHESCTLHISKPRAKKRKSVSNEDKKKRKRKCL